jgi:hypothetical protein
MNIKTPPMPIGHAIRLIKELDSDADLRRCMNKCDTLEELEALLLSKGHNFTTYEFEEAVNHLHVACATYEQANALMAKANWYMFLVTALPKNTLYI